MRYGSVCSGIEAASAAWHVLGWQPAWFAEIEAFPSAVLAHHYPDVPNLGDMTQIAGAIESGAVEAPDVLVGGTPCQAFSVAGLRMSLADARGNLSLAFVELANAIDDFRRHRGHPAGIIVWENVPGVLNTSDNAFGCFLGGMAGSDTTLIPPQGSGWPDAGVVVGPRRTVAWRVLDAQFFGLAQRRRRVFVVASARDGFDPAAVLLEWDGVRRDSAPSREAREGTAGGAAQGALLRCGCGYRFDVSLGAYGCPNCEGESGPATSHAAATTMAHGQGGAEIAEDRAPTLTCNHEAPIAFLPETAHTLRAEGFDASEDGTGRGTPLVPVSVALRGREGGAACEVGDDVAFTLRASSGGGDTALGPNVVFPQMQVRRLTPRECERLQGFPDDWTLVPTTTVTHRKNCALHGTKEVVPEGTVRAACGCKAKHVSAEQCPDGPRYKALGNSMAVPVMRWIGARIARQVGAA